MELYTSDRRIVNYDNSFNNRIGNESASGSIYRLSNGDCLKVLNDQDSECNREELMLIKELQLPSFYRIYDFLYDSDDRFKGYTMKYYDSDVVDILGMPCDYTIDNIEGICSDLRRLASKSIIANDLRRDNVIISRDNIVVIDADLYTRLRYVETEAILERNIGILYRMFKDIYFESLRRFYGDDSMFNSYMESISGLFFNNGYRNVDSVKRKLKCYRTPMEYVRRNVR